MSSNWSLLEINLVSILFLEVTIILAKSFHFETILIQGCYPEIQILWLMTKAWNCGINLLRYDIHVLEGKIYLKKPR